MTRIRGDFLLGSRIRGNDGAGRHFSTLKC